MDIILKISKCFGKKMEKSLLNFYLKVYSKILLVLNIKYLKINPKK